MKASIVAASHLLKVSLILSTTCLIHRVTCFSLQRTFVATQRCRNNPLSSTSKDITDEQWGYQSSYNNDKDEIIHGRYNAVIIKTSDLANRWIGSFDPTIDITDDNSSSLSSPSSSPTSPPIEALQAIQATHRWSDKFVCQLNLCPWARNSLDEPNAICYWALLIDEEDDDGIILDKMEEIVREAGVQLTLATSDDETEEDGGRIIDPSVAISFIVLVPTKGRANGSKNYSDALDFGSFHEFFIDLEDRLLDECDDYWDMIGADDADNEDNEEVDKDDEAVGNNNVPNVNSLGCDITIAAFHPNWQFNGSNEQSDGDAIDYEKRTPYATISIVVSSVIEGLMKEREDGGETDKDGNVSSSSAPATERIADLNEKTLCSIGVERLKEIFKKEVMECPMKGET